MTPLTNFSTCAELALEQNALVEARVYLKMAMLRDENRAEPYYWLSELCETQGEIREALYYYCRAIDAGPTFQPSRKALRPLKTIGDRDKWLRIRPACGSPLVPMTARNSSVDTPADARDSFREVDGAT